MLPPVASAVLDRNPRFKALYQNLAASRLNSDASTRLIKQQRAQAEVEKQLIAARKDAAVANLLQGALDSICRRASELPPELLETCHIISAQLNGELSNSDLEILRDDIDFFVNNVPLVAIAVSKQLQQSAVLLAKITTADGTSNDGLQDISKLPLQATALQEAISNQTISIASTRMRIAELSDQIHASYRELFEVSVRIIEQTLHGSVARGVKAKAEHLAVVAKGMQLKVQILAQTDSMLTDPTLNSELRAYCEKLASMEDDLSARFNASETALKGYESAGRGMADLAKRYAEVIKECADVQAEIKTLEDRASEVD